MDIFLYIIAGILILVGLAGCILPVLPGPPISYFGLLILQLTTKKPFTTKHLVILFVIVLIVTLLDNIVPILGTKRTGGSKYGIIGASIGLILGFFVMPPMGIIILPFIGAIIGELLNGKTFDIAFKSGFGTFLGFLFGTLLKLITSGWITYEYIKSMFI